LQAKQNVLYYHLTFITFLSFKFSWNNECFLN
jgi:hypothetical protein